MSQRKQTDAESTEPGQLEALSLRPDRSRLLPCERFVDYLLRQAEDPGRRKGERTRARLKVGAVRILETTGYHGLQMKGVTDEAGLSEGVIYNYFKDKRELMLEVMAEFGQYMFQFLLSVVPDGEAFSRILQSNLAYVRFVSANLGLWKCGRHLSDDIPEIRDSVYRWNHGWSVLVARGLQRRTGSNNPETAMLTARALSAMVDELLHEVFVRQNVQFAHLAADPPRLAEMISIYWYRMAYGANPKSDALGEDHPLLELSL